MIDYDYYESKYETTNNKEHKINRLKQLGRYCDCKYCRGLFNNPKTWKAHRKTQYIIKTNNTKKVHKNPLWKYKRNNYTYKLRYNGLMLEQWLYYTITGQFENKVKKLENKLQLQLETFWLLGYGIVQASHAIDGEAYISGEWYTARELVEAGFAPQIYRYGGEGEFRSLIIDE